MREDIPPLLPPGQMRPIRSQADLHRFWRALLGPLGFTDRVLWVAFIDAADRASAGIGRCTALPEHPEQDVVRGLMDLCAEVLRGVFVCGRVAFLVSRPGPSHVTSSDQAWGRALTQAARSEGLPCEPVHIASDDDLRILAPDDLVGAL
jgi:hypothetical protein